ncbi:MAG TPA: N,N-dimethylformamidase beta subunit family domain-containing protein [Thermoanaerobaculia bacterium]|nr:N,N-dimethylformamidase beta subunit family domain-containing protein [Thermoanaerobaculia bacterium]
MSRPDPRRAAMEDIDEQPLVGGDQPPVGQESAAGHGSARGLADTGLDRRQLLAGMAAAGVVSTLGLQGCRRTAARRDLIRAENAKPGTTDWLLSRTAVDPATRYRCPWIEGYCSRTSLRAGERLAFAVSTNPPSRFVIDLYRMGWYGGKGGRHVHRLGPFQGAAQPDPPIEPERLRDCRWQTAAGLVIPEDWPSGVYLGKLTAERGGVQSYVVFILRDDRECDVLLQSSTNTWNAYNRWPDQWSLYDNGVKDWYWGPSVRVSWNRPYGKYCQILDNPLTQGSGEFLLWELPLVFWLEKEGYDVSYTANVDTHLDREGLRRGKLWLSVGHDEYWSLEMFDNVKAARDAGVNLAFLSGNTCYGVIDFHPDHSAAPRRAIRRIGQYGPLDPRVVKEAFPELLMLPHNGPDEALLIGARTCYPITGSADWICTSEKSWVYEGTGMRDGDRVGGLIGWEFHGQPAEIPGLEIVASGLLRRWGGSPRYTATLYPGPKGNFVFNAATCWWADGMSEPPGYVRPIYGRRTRLQGPDPRIQRITANLIRRAVRA